MARFGHQSFLELLTWDPRDIATLADDLEEEMAAAKRAR